MILVGNKCDLSNSWVATSDKGQHYADSLGIKFMETSAKTNTNVEVVCYYLPIVLIKRSA